MAEGLRRVEESLRAAAERGDIECLYASIKEDPTVLDRIDAVPFVETPLHAAASAGQELFAKEILRLKPSFGPKLNPDGQLIRVKGKEGETPLHIIVKNEDIDHVEADQEQRVEGNVNGGQQEGEDPRILILAEFLFACPKSIQDRTIRDETALHIAVKNNNKHAVEVILGFIRRTRTTWVPVARDFKGNTVLHMAVSSSQLEMVELIVKEFLWDNININIKNYVAKKTALDIALLSRTDEARLIEKSLRDAGAKTSSPSVNDYSLAKFLRRPEQVYDIFYKYFLFAKRDMSIEKRNIGLVVATLIATATYQVVLTPPGGQGGGNDQLLRNGTYISTIVSSTNYPFAAANTSFVNATLFAPTYDQGDGGGLGGFYIWNAAAFFYSVQMIAVFLLDTNFYPLQLALVLLTFGYLTSFLLVITSGNLPMMYYYGINIVLCLSLVLVYFYNLFLVRRNRFPTTASMGDDKHERFRMLGNLLRNYYDGQCSHGQSSGFYKEYLS